jgi:hypothetical protein
MKELPMVNHFGRDKDRAYWKSMVINLLNIAKNAFFPYTQNPKAMLFILPKSKLLNKGDYKSIVFAIII